MEDNVVVAVEQSLPGILHGRRTCRCSHHLNVLFAKTQQALERQADATLTTIEKIQHVYEMMHDMARCNLRRFKRNRDSDNLIIRFKLFI